MDSLFPACLDFTLANEGGFSDNPADPGGATFKGITLASLRDYWGDPDATVEDLRGLDPETISWFYQQRFWSPMQCGVLPAGIDLMIFDHGVNVGKARPVPMMQRLLAVDDDGIVGPITLAAISARTRMDSSAHEHEDDLGTPARRGRPRSGGGHDASRYCQLHLAAPEPDLEPRMGSQPRGPRQRRPLRQRHPGHLP